MDLDECDNLNVDCCLASSVVFWLLCMLSFSEALLPSPIVVVLDYCTL